MTNQNNAPSTARAQDTSRHPTTERFRKQLQELAKLHELKAKDYGSDEDPLANIRDSAKLLGLDPMLGALLRLTDKVYRLGAFARKGELANEAPQDSLRDIAVYAVICLVLMEENE